MPPNRLYSILTALPAMMLIAGLIYYFNIESRQAKGKIIEKQSQLINGSFKGLSGLNANNSSQYYLWINTPKRVRGIRIKTGQVALLNPFREGQPISILAAPRIDGSKTLWLYKVQPQGSQITD